MRFSPLVLAAAMASAAFPVHAEELTLDRIFQSPDLNGPSPRLARLSPGGRLVTLLRNRAEDKDRYDLWAIDADTGAARMLVDSLKVGSGAELSEEEKMRRERARVSGTKGIVAYDWAPDGKAILVPLDGDLFVAVLGGDVRRITETPETEVDAQVSETGRYVSFVRDQNLFVSDLAGKATQLTTDGGGTLSWGSAEFVAQEEMDRTTGHWWSPDDRYLAVARVDESPVKVVTRAAIGAGGTRVYEQRYPAAGTPNAIVDLYVMRPDGSSRVKVDLGANPDIYLARVDWTPDGKTLLVQRESRDQMTLDLLAVDPETGASRILFTETAKTWINLHDNLRALKDGSLLWSSERSGYSHLYRWKNGRWTQLTSGNWMVNAVEGVDEGKGLVYFTANKDTPLEQHLYVARLDRKTEPKRLTESGYWNAAAMDKAARRAIVTRSGPSQPSQVYLTDTNGKRVAWIEQNALDANHPYAPYLASHAVPQFGTIKAEDGSDLHYKMLTPKMEAGKRYPVFVQVYGGPGAGRQVTRAWAGALQQYLVDKGWIVFSVDGRGTPARGKAFEDHIYRAMGSVEVKDQLAGVDFLKDQPFVDPDRIAVYGWSYGGYMTLKLLEGLPGVYAAGVAGAPVTRWELYDTHYTERYMGNPLGADAAAYEKSSNIPNASKIADPILLIHGMADDNVVFDNMTALMGEMQGKKVPFELMVYPGATHRVSGEGPQVHMWKTIERFLNREVKAKP
ncbi:S9 family peptidase [Allosphingosinicella flava]|uniref:S9 family peptidase n=1 Tax=Allosphingosinicella flava TaxID=2771430 RepID=A0A7T2LN41_9SPHN|nr:DPP IV N-terminal domain-containing protein [Sphingosinicella flava]QPQ55792.1 S9 family peptidase [Sphingosinicella flava]